MSGLGPVVTPSVVPPVLVISVVTPTVVAWVSPCESVDVALALVVGVLLVGGAPVVASPLLLALVLALVVVVPAESLPRVPSSPQAPMLAPINIHTGARAPTRPIRPIRFISPGDHIGRGTGRARVERGPVQMRRRAHARQGAGDRDADCSLVARRSGGGGDNVGEWPGGEQQRK